MGAMSARGEFIRFIDRNEGVQDLILEGKARTWQQEAEHAIVTLARGTPGQRPLRAMIRGGRDGIEFVRLDNRLYVEIAARLVRVVRILAHTHPRVTGPSEGDLDALRILGQKRSYIFEIGGEPHGALIRP
jgi:hypothetical protein